jgi:hypothetical protein
MLLPRHRSYESVYWSEVSNLQFLRKTQFTVSTVFDLNPDQDHPVGVDCILMEKLSGKSLSWHVTTAEQRKEVMRQLADIYIELRAFPLSAMGSFNQQNSCHGDLVALESLADFQGLDIRILRRFASPEEYYSAYLQMRSGFDTTARITRRSPNR